MTLYPRFSETWLLLLCLLGVASLPAQHQLGWSLDPHAGIGSAFLQPAATADIPYDWDLNLATAGFFLNNEYAFVRKASALGLLGDLRRSTSIAYDADALAVRLNGQVYNFDFPTEGREQAGSVGANLTGPALSFQLGEFTRLGAFTRLRVLASTHGVDENFNFYTYDELSAGTEFTISETYAAATVWSEIGGHISRAFFVGSDAEVRLGVNLRYLVTNEGLSAYNSEGARLLKTGGDSTLISNGDAEIGLTEAFRSLEPGLGVSGRGYAADLGLQYAWGNQPDGSYRYVVGISLLDFGQATYSQNTQQHRFINDGTIQVDADDYPFTAEDGVNQALRQLSRDAFDGNAGASLTSSTFSVGLPTALSIQFAVRPIPGVQFSGAYVGDAPFAVRRHKQGQQFTLAGHYSKKWYGGGLTTSLRDWRGFNIGLQLRAGPVFFGTDRLVGTLLPAGELSDGDLYFGLRLHEFGGKGRKGKKGKAWKSKKGKSKPVKCYDF